MICKIHTITTKLTHTHKKTQQHTREKRFILLHNIIFWLIVWPIENTISAPLTNININPFQIWWCGTGRRGAHTYLRQCLVAVRRRTLSVRIVPSPQSLAIVATIWPVNCHRLMAMKADNPQIRPLLPICDRPADRMVYLYKRKKKM